MKLTKNPLPVWISIGIFFSLLYVYFWKFIPYHLLNLEQGQLFLWNSQYLQHFYLKPGWAGFISGEFITQFFITPWLAALILTSLFGLFYLLFRFIFSKHGLNGILYPILPLVLMVALQSSFHYAMVYHTCMILGLGLFSIYISLSANILRWLLGIVSGIILYFLTGGYFILFLLLCIVHEIFNRKEAYRFLAVLVYLFLIFIIPFGAWKFLYFMEFKDAWIYPVPVEKWANYEAFLILFLFYTPVLLISSGLYSLKSGKSQLSFSWKIKYIAGGLIIFLLAVVSVFRYAYNKKKEAFLKIDYFVQSKDWEKVLEYAKKYPGKNQVVMYYTNLALSKTDRLANEMFSWKQSGTSGLWLEWKRNETAAFYGGDIFYHMGYTSEAFRWAFEAMETKGPCPRLLKRLALTSLIHSNYALAGKYLNILNQSWNYKNWAKHYQAYLSDTSLISADKELAEKRLLIPTADFISEITRKDIGLMPLLNNHPNNRMAFEYLMAKLLLEKNMKAFISNINKLKELGYSSIPVHYEEALIFNTALTKQNMIPEGYSIRPETRQRFHNYADLFAQFSNSPEFAAQQLYPQYGNTFWFYMQFGQTND